MVARKRAGDAKAAFARVGTVAVPELPAGEPAPRPRDATTPPRRRGAAPTAATGTAFTVRFDPDESDEIDLWVLRLRRELGRRQLNKSEVVRALLDAARTDDGVREALLARLRANQAT